MQKKFLHTRFRVSNLDKSIDFYRNLGFELTERRPRSPAGNELAFLELPGNEVFLELAYSDGFELPKIDDLVHIALGVPDLFEYSAELEGKGIEIWPESWREDFVQAGKRRMAFLTDPDGYEVELLEQ